MTAALLAQVRAATPDRSSWVSANAGSGKTRVLTDRVARLLLAGTEPQRILCLTYTKAAAAEMQNRLFKTLGSWAMLEDADLRAALRDLGEPGEAIPADRLNQARTLFARALETPGGLRIQTIHAFCESLLRRFPIEAGVAPQFSVLDDRQARGLRETLLDRLAEDATSGFAELARHVGGTDIDSLLQEISRHRDGFAGPHDPTRLAAVLGCDPDGTLAALTAATVGAEEEALLRHLVPILRASGSNDAKAAEKIAAALTDPGGLLETLEGVLLWSASATKQEPFTPKRSFPTKAIRQKNETLCRALDALMDRVAAARPQRLALAAFARSVALDRFGRAWLRAYAQAKATRGLLDFDDMIDRANALLAAPGTAAWVLWRLDGGLDHILVDEAQDTSPAQWRVITALSDEFFAGSGARDTTRTIFVVGDEKQSIYSFQGADPRAFAEKRQHFDRVLQALEAPLQRCDLLYSFRSADPVLRLVDRVFAGAAGEGIEEKIAHIAYRTEMPGRVELWPFLPKPEQAEAEEWDDTNEGGAADNPVSRLAATIAERIAGWLAEGHPLPGTGPSGTGRPVRAGDVMILVQRRGAIFDAVIRALKQAGVPVAGADVLKVGGELAVRDLVAALRIAATPADDLSLAAVLRSPLGGFGERALFDLAHGREGTLWQAFANAVPQDDPVRRMLEEVRDHADFLRPFELLSRMLVRHGGRRRLVARLGAEAEDGIDALLDQALAYEQVEAPTLTGFLAWFDRDMVTVKRRTEEGTDQVRVMTVHGAKGLEAPIVILPDTAVTQEGRNAPAIVRTADDLPAWLMKRDLCPPAIARAEDMRRRLVRQESRRLLYVALTRARQWLIVCGAGAAATEGNSGESWHRLVEAAMQDWEGVTTEAGPLGETRVLCQGWEAPAGAAGGSAAATVPAAALAPVPAWLEATVLHPEEPPRPLAPSQLGGDLVLAGEALVPAAEHGVGYGSPEDARVRGTAVHLLLEHLIGCPADQRASLAERLLPDLPERAAILAEAETVLAAPALAFLFGENGLAEVDVAAPLPGPGATRILGRIDRLVVTDDAVLAVDFKSNRLVPERPEATPEGILRQLGAYRLALRALWPDKPVEVAILWTRTARLMRIPEALADAAFARARLLDPAETRPYVMADDA